VGFKEITEKSMKYGFCKSRATTSLHV